MSKEATIRPCEIKVDHDGIGAWEVTCGECPLLPHLTVLGMKPRACTAGIQTNIQGAVPLSKCDYYVPDSVEKGDKPKTLKLKCTYGHPPVQMHDESKRG